MAYGIRPEDFCLLTPHLAADGEVAFYALAGTVPTKTVGGVVIAPKPVYPLETRPVSGDPAYEPIDTVTVSGATQTQVIQASRRLAMPAKWASVGSWGTFSWLRCHGNGQQLGPNCDYREKQGTNSTTEVVHNPTFGGGLSQFTDFLMPEAAAALRYSPQVPGTWVAVGGAATAGVARIRGAVYPMHFSPDGTGQTSGGTDPANWDHGGELGVTDVLFWDQRQVFEVRPAWGGDEKVHRCTLWEFQREGWNSVNAAGAQPFLVSPNNHISLVDAFVNAYVIDLENETTLDATAFLLGQDYDVQLDIQKAGLQITVWTAPETVVWQASPVPSGYCAIVLRSTTPDFALALVARMFDTGDGARRVSRMGFGTYRHGPIAYPGHVTTPDEALYGPTFWVECADSSREAGWVACSFYLVTGTYAEVLAKLTEIKTAGLLEELPETDLPSATLEDTAAVSDYYLPPVVVTTAPFVVETGTGAADANSLCSVAVADAYHLAHGNPSTWSGKTQAQKEDYLREATQYLRIVYEPACTGITVSHTQGVMLPRYGMYDHCRDRIVPDTEIPLDWQHAVAAAAGRLAAGTPLLSDEQAGTGGIKSESKSISGVGSKSITYEGTRSTQIRMRDVEAFVDPYLRRIDEVDRA